MTSTAQPLAGRVAYVTGAARSQGRSNFIHSFSPGALPTDSLAAPKLISDIVVWLASDASSLVTAAQIPADKGYLKI